MAWSGLAIAGIIFLILGILMIIIGIVIYERNIKDKKDQPFWVWILIIGGIILLILGIIGLGMGFYSDDNTKNYNFGSDKTEFLKQCVLGFPECSHENPCPVHETWGKLSDHVEKMLLKNSVADLSKDTIKFQHLY